MPFQGYQREANPQVGHEIPGAEEGTQMMLTQVQLAQKGSSTVSQALTQHVQQTAKNPPLAATASTAAVQQIQTSIKFDVPVVECYSAACWLTWSQRAVYQARVCGFEAELAAAEGEGLSVEADVFYRSNADPVRLRNNAHAAWMTLINNCRGMTLEIVQRSRAPSDAWQNLESHDRAKGTREILCLSHEVNGQTIQPGEDPFQLMREVYRLAADFYNWVTDR